VTFTVDAFPGETFKGQVGKIRLNAAMTQNVVTYTVEVVADNANGRLLPYLTANVKFELARRDGVLQVPNAALRWVPTEEQVLPEARRALGGGAADGETVQGVVWVPEGAFVRPVFVRLGLTDDVTTEVTGEGLAEGTKVVTGQEEAATATTGTTTHSNPFLPKPPSAGKNGPPPPPM